jgi:hypothetical protein
MKHIFIQLIIIKEKGDTVRFNVTIYSHRTKSIFYTSVLLNIIKRKERESKNTVGGFERHRMLATAIVFLISRFYHLSEAKHNEKITAY